MTYATHNKPLVEQYAATLRTLHPQNLYYVQEHDKGMWGVVEYVAYCEDIPHRCMGFIWHDYTQPWSGGLAA